MDYFMNKGQCRVCSQMFCCLKHQKEHERLLHNEFADWLNVFPLQCRRCYRTINNIRDLKLKCIRFNTGAIFTKHSIVVSSSNMTQTNTKYKRPRDTTLSKNWCCMTTHSEDINLNRKKITASRRYNRNKTTSPSVILVADFTETQMSGDLINTMFSPQFNISYKILTNDVKSSTPLYHEKENFPVIAVLEKNEISMYKTPEIVQNSSLLVISSFKKKSTPRESIMKNYSMKMKTNSRKVTFEEEKCIDTSEKLEKSVYGTPETTLMETDGNCDEVHFPKTNEYSEVEISIYRTFETNIFPATKKKSELEIVDHSANNREKNCKTIRDLVKNIRLTVYGIPRLIFKVCDWSLRTMGKRKRDSSENSSDLDPTNHLLKRKPLFSQWVSTRSLARKPLSLYSDRDFARHQRKTIVNYNIDPI